METGRKALLFIAAGIVTASLCSALLPAERKWNDRAPIRIGAGDDITGVLTEEIVRGLGDRYELETGVESSSFKDC
ncbi:MAG: hypothetical protein IJJ38_10840 [Lachnospiraceae bacterium]|nr:hypothetical protein [Lachnospiraceae bacterium]